MGNSCKNKKDVQNPFPVQKSGGDPPSDYMPRSFSIKLREVPSVLKSNRDSEKFSPYFLKIYPKALKYFQETTTVDSIKFENRLASLYGISVEFAKTWVSAYLDYMIMVGWDINRKSNAAHYSAVYIQLVTRLHILFGDSYLEFSKILTDGAGPIHFAPCSMVVQKDEALFDQLPNIYQLTKQTTMSNIYTSTELNKSGEEIKNSQKLWDSFVMTTVKNDFKFCFKNKEEKSKFQDVLLQSAGLLPLTSCTIENIVNASDRLRESQSLDKLNQKMVFPNIIEDFRSTPKGGILTEVMKIDNMKFPTDMITLLAWENNIPVFEALQWLLEYKKFLFIVLMTGSKKTTMVPSMCVDITWQVHMQYTESYNNEMSIFKYPPVYKFRKNKSEEEVSHNYKVTIGTLDSYFKTVSNAYWPHFYQPDERIWGLYHIFFGSKMIDVDKRRSAIAKYTKYSKGKSTLKLSATFDADIITVLQTSPGFFEIDYEEEDSNFEPSPSVSPMTNQMKSKDRTPERNSNVLSKDSASKYQNYN